ncbi:UNVERIFIED_CONTAM: hypothetical protein K2H54_050271 [Gekko kuhli]
MNGGHCGQQFTHRWEAELEPPELLVPPVPQVSPEHLDLMDTKGLQENLGKRGLRENLVDPEDLVNVDCLELL